MMSPFRSSATSSSWGDDAFGPAGGKEAPAALPAPVEEGPDETGVKTITTYRRTDKGVEKVVRRVKVITTYTRVPRGVRERKEKMARFGAAKSGNEGTTYPSTEEVRIELLGAAPEKSGLEAIVQQGGSLASCRRCGGPHWTLSCPYKDVMPMGGTLPGGLPPSADGGAGGDGAPPPPMGALGGAGAYVPPSMRSGGGGASEVREVSFDEMVQLRVNNLSPETSEDDLRNLFQPFGRIDRIFVAKDRITGESRGFAFVKYTRHADAEAAKANLNGYPLSHMILRVEWSEPREGGGGAAGGKFSALAASGRGSGVLSGYGRALADGPAHRL